MRTAQSVSERPFAAAPGRWQARRMRPSFLCLALLAGCGGTVTESVDASPDTTADATSDLGASDVAADTAIDTRAACIDDAGTVPVDVKLCGSTTECTVRTRMVDC